MNYDVWKRKSFQSLIGGIKVSETEKQENLDIINNAIQQNNIENKVIELKPTQFAKSYPESMYLVKSYYESLYKAKTANKKGWDGKDYINTTKEKEIIRNKINIQKKELIIIYMPILISKNTLVKEIIDLFDITINDVSIIMNNYKKIIKKTKTIENLGEKQEKYNIAKLLYEEIVLEGLKIHELCKKYKTNAHAIKKHIELLKEIDENLYNETQKCLEEKISNKNSLLKELTLKIGTYSMNKIKIELLDQVIEMPFTMLDYYTLTDYSPKTLMNFLNHLKDFNPANSDENRKRNCAVMKIRSLQNTGKYLSKEEVLQKKMVAGKNGNIIKMDETICNNIFETFEAEGIPKTENLIATAFYRLALGMPILPLTLLGETKILNQEEINKKEVKPNTLKRIKI